MTSLGLHEGESSFSLYTYDKILIRQMILKGGEFPSEQTAGREK